MVEKLSGVVDSIQQSAQAVASSSEEIEVQGEEHFHHRSRDNSVSNKKDVQYRRDDEGRDQLYRWRTGFRYAGKHQRCRDSFPGAGETHYTANAGLLPLREAIARRVANEISLTADPEREIIVTAGGMEALMLGLMVLIDPGDEVIISNPHWPNYPQQVQMCGGIPRFVTAREENSFVLSPDDIRKAVTSRTKVIVLNSPSNPTGSVIDRNTMSEIARVAAEHDLFVISDEVYHHFLYDGATFASASSLEGMRERTLMIDSFSKTYAMTGWRVGDAVGPEIIARNMVKLQENVVGCVNTQAQYAAIGALEGPAISPVSGRRVHSTALSTSPGRG